MEPREIQHNDTPPNFILMPTPAVIQLGNQSSYPTETASKPALEFLLFDTNCMSTERAHTLLWLALHQLWLLSWMSVESERPKPIRLNVWLKAVRQSEADLQKELRGKRTLKNPVSALDGDYDADRLLCANDLFHIAGGMNRWMMLEQRYKFLNTSKKWDLFYLIKPDIALSIHQYLDGTNMMDFRFRPGVPSSASSAMHPESWNSKNQNWKFIFKGFPPELGHAHRRFMIRLIRGTIKTTIADNDDDDGDDDETLKKRKQNNLSKPTNPSKRIRLEPQKLQAVSEPHIMCPLPAVDSTWQPAADLSTSKITHLNQSSPATRSSPAPQHHHHQNHTAAAKTIT